MRVRIALVVTLFLSTVCHSADNPPAQPPVSQLTARGEAKLKANISIANWANAGAAKLSYVAVRYALDRQTERALKEALPNAGKVLKETGASGVLLEARYVKDSGLANPEAGPPNLTQALEGNQMHYIGAGSVPRDVLAIALQEPSLEFGHRKDQEFVAGATRDYWVTSGQGGKLLVAELNHDSLYTSARDIVLNSGLFEQMKAASYRNALSDMIKAAERNAMSRDGKRAAAQLLSERNEAIQELMTIDADLQKELAKAKEANNDADKFALAATLAGAGSSIIQASEAQQKSAKPEVTTQSTTQRMETPSGAVIELIRQRVAIEKKVILNDEKVGAYLQQNGKTVYVPLYRR